MNSSYDTDISAQTSQLRPATFQHGSTRSTWAPSNYVPSPVVRDWLRSPPAQLQGNLRPLFFSEFAERTKHHWESLKNDSKPLKGWLRLAESIRRDAKSFHKQGDLESAFVEYAKAATIVLEVIPAHPDYRVLLSTTHRHNMGLHGQQILDSLAETKISIMRRYDQLRANPSSVQPQAPASYRIPQPLVAHRSFNSHGTNMPTSSSAPSSSHSRASTPLRSRIPSPYDPSPTEDDTHPIPQPLVAHRSIDSHGTNTPTSSSAPPGSHSRASIPLRSCTPSPYEPSPTEDDAHPIPQPLVTHRIINSHGTNTPTSSSAPSSSHSRASIPLRSRTPSPYEQNPTEDDRARRERVDALLREDPRRREDVYPADGTRADQWHAREDDTRRHREWEEEGRRQVAEQRRLEQDGILHRQRETALPSHRRAVALPSEDTLEVVKGSLSIYRHSKAGHDGEGEGEEVAHAARTAGGHDEPLSGPETPKQRPEALHPTKAPAQRGNASHKPTLPSTNHSDGLALPTDPSMQPEAAANPTPEVFEGFDMLHRPPESQLHDQQPEYLRILQDKFGTPRPDHGHRYSFTDDTSSARNEGDGDYQKSFVDPDNESCNGRCSVKTVSKGSLFTPSILSPARSELSSIFD